MSETEALALLRVGIAVLMVPFAWRARYYVLMTIWLVAIWVPLSFVLFNSLLWSALAAVPLWGLLAWHTLDVTRKRHPKHPPR